MNTELLERIAAHIEAHPEEFDMADWICGSSACIAGHALKLTDAQSNPFDIRGTYRGPATDVLEITDSQAERLFFGSVWPREFSIAYYGAQATPPASERAKIGAARIRHFIQTGE